MYEPIEQHPSFAVTNDALELINPEIREKLTHEIEENGKKWKPEAIRSLEDRSDKPVRDFFWRDSKGQTRLSEMNAEELLSVARHCVAKSNNYHKRLLFFMNVLEIVEEHASAKGHVIPETIEEIEKMQQQLQQEVSKPESVEDVSSYSVMGHISPSLLNYFKNRKQKTQ